MNAIPSELRNQTKLTRDGHRSMVNHKPYRSAALKKKAGEECFKAEGGQWRSTVRVLFH